MNGYARPYDRRVIIHILCSEVIPVKRLPVLAALLLSLCLITASAEDLLVLDGFNVRPDPAFLWQTQPRVHNAVVLSGTLPGGEAAEPVLQVRWRAEPLLTEDMTETTLPFWADWHVRFMQNDFRGRLGFEDASCELLDAALIPVDGRQVLSVAYTVTVPGETYCRRDAVAGGIYGYWIFSGTAPEAEEAGRNLQVLLDAVAWTEIIVY